MLPDTAMRAVCANEDVAVNCRIVAEMEHYALMVLLERKYFFRQVDLVMWDPLEQQVVQFRASKEDQVVSGAKKRG